MILRVFDLGISISLLLVLWPFLIIFYVVGLFDTGKPIFIQERVGFNQNTFKLIKFRTMTIGTASVGTHEVNAASVTPLGKLMRKSKIDELPQLLNVLKGQMSLVGPRPCLPIQHDVIDARKLKDVFAVRPGITGLAQINEIDMSTPELLAKTDRHMIDSLNIKTYFRLLIYTALGKGQGDRTNPNK